MALKARQGGDRKILLEIMKTESVKEFFVLGRKYDGTRQSQKVKGFGNTSKQCFRKKKLKNNEELYTLYLKYNNIISWEMCPQVE